MLLGFGRSEELDVLEHHHLLTREAVLDHRFGERTSEELAIQHKVERARRLALEEMVDDLGEAEAGEAGGKLDRRLGHAPWRF